VVVLRAYAPTKEGVHTTAPAVTVSSRMRSVRGLEPERSRASTRDRQGGTVDIDADDLTFGTDDLSRQERSPSRTNRSPR
jgi:hypothetical protein